MGQLPVFLDEAGDHGLLEAHVRPLQLVRTLHSEDPCLVHERHPVAQLALVEIGGGHDDRHACLLHVEQNVPELPAGHRVHAVGGLVQDEAFRFVDEHAGQPQLLFHAAREVSGQPVEEGQQVGESQVFLFPALALHAMDAEDIHEEVDVLLHGQVLVEAEALGHVTDERLDLPPLSRRVDPAYGDTPGSRPDHGRDEPQQGRLAGAVRADEAEDGPPANTQGDTLQGARGAEGHGDALDPYEIVTGGMHRRASRS
jgi:hypothetical protein